MPSVLFVCKGNLYRSPVAEACFRKSLSLDKTKSEWTVGSAGTWTNSGVAPDPKFVREVQRLGLDISSHCSRLIDAELLSHYGLVLAMEAGQKEALQVEFPAYQDRIFLLSEVVDGIAYDVSNPEGDDSASDADIIEELVELIERGYQKICELAISFSDGT
jgi:protein-tyrosine phosphatase